jgi:hypothetical protein
VAAAPFGTVRPAAGGAVPGALGRNVIREIQGTEQAYRKKELAVFHGRKAILDEKGEVAKHGHSRTLPLGLFYQNLGLL